jgi:uncharacterized protein (TIGR02145 family)
MILRIEIAIVILATMLFSCNTANPAHTGTTSAGKSNDSVLVDSDGNRYPVKSLSDNILWMTNNLNLAIPGSYCYEDKKHNCQIYGRLYTWESAKNGCMLLGNGWRLPTNDEWKGLLALHGGIAKDSDEIRKEAYKEVMYPGDSKFNAVLGGGRDFEGLYSRLEAHGFYWTATENDSTAAWFYNFGKGSQSLFQQNGGEKTRAFSVRCVKSVKR